MYRISCYFLSWFWIIQLNGQFKVLLHWIKNIAFFNLLYWLTFFETFFEALTSPFIESRMKWKFWALLAVVDLTTFFCITCVISQMFEFKTHTRLIQKNYLTMMFKKGLVLWKVIFFVKNYPSPFLYKFYITII